MSESLRLLDETLSRLFADAYTGSAASVENAAFDASLWAEVQQLGLAALLVPESEGGGDGLFVDARVVARASGRYAVRIPLVESILGVRWLASSGLDRPDGPLTVAHRAHGHVSGKPGNATFSGSVAGVPWGSQAAAVVCVVGEEASTMLVALERGTASDAISHNNMAGEPRQTLHFRNARIRSASIAPESRERLFDELALMRAGQIAGALSAALDRSIRHASERIQFGRPIAKFQAVQHELARLGSELAAVDCATQAACLAADRGPARFEIACARLRANLASELGVRIAHQIHGAIGFTEELDLHLFTQRLLAWRSELGNDAYWADRLGAEVASQGADAFWTALTGRADRVALGGE